MVAEYRDKEIRVEYPLSDDCFYHVSECPLAYVLPLNLLINIKAKQTKIQKAISECYQQCGIVIDTDKNVFYLDDNSNVEVFNKINFRDVSYTLGDKVTFIKAVAQFIKDNSLTIENDLDCQITGFKAREQVLLLSLLLGDFDKTAFDKVIENDIEDFINSDEIKINDVIAEIVKSCFNNGFVNYDITQLAGWEEKNIGSSIIGKVFKQNYTEYNDGLTIHKFIKIKAKELHDSTSITEQIIEDNNHYADDDLIEITGETKKWFQEIKDYAEGCKFGKIAKKYGKRIYKNYAQWDKNGKYWLVHYISFKELIADHPKAEKELIITKHTK